MIEHQFPPPLGRSCAQERETKKSPAPDASGGATPSPHHEASRTMNGSRSSSPRPGSPSSLDALSRTIEGLEARIEGLMNQSGARVAAPKSAPGPCPAAALRSNLAGPIRSPKFASARRPWKKVAPVAPNAAASTIVATISLRACPSGHHRCRSRAPPTTHAVSPAQSRHRLPARSQTMT